MVESIRPIPFKQDKGFGCSIYCLANFFNDGSILEHIEEKGYTAYQENQFIKKHGLHKTLHFETIACLPASFGVWHKDEVFNYELDDTDDAKKLLKETDPYFVYLLSINTGGTVKIYDKEIPKQHRILMLQQLSTGHCYIVDSLKPYVNRFENNKDILKLYDVTSISVIADDVLSDVSTERVYYNGEFLKHLTEKKYDHNC